MSLAYVWGVKKMILLGFDMQRTNGKSHWHGDHPKGLGNGSRYSGWLVAMGKLAKGLSDKGVEVVNCSRQSALQCFRRSTIDKELPDERIPVVSEDLERVEHADRVQP
jgi:hypothetical protein